MSTAPREVTVNAPRSQLAPIDTSVAVPPSVKAAAAKAEALHQQAYQTQPPAPVEPPVEPPAPPVEPAVAQVQPPVASTPPAIPPTPSEPVNEQQWEHRYNSMKGRYDQASRSIGMMQEQMQEMSDEIMRWQNHAAAPAAAAPANQPNTGLLTPEERAEYGTDLIDVTQRAAREAINPEIADLRQNVTQLQQTIQRNNTASLHLMLDTNIPRWRDINRSVEFKRWLSLPDLYSGMVRHKLLTSAFQAADAPRVIGFFNGFIRDEALITGTGAEPVPQPAAGDPPPAPRVPAVTLESLAAPGRAKPTGGGANPQSSVEKPVFTRADIAKFYRDVRTGAYAGRETEKNRQEQLLFDAQNDGRIR